MPSAGDTPLKTSWTWEEWQAGRAALRAVTRKISSKPLRKKSSSSDHRLRPAFDGERGPAFNKSFEPPSAP